MNTPRHFPLARVLCLLAAILSFASWAGAQEVEVTSLKFNNLRAPNGSPNNWLEADVAIEARPVPTNLGRMVARVRVAITLGFELPAASGGERRIEFYRAEAECVALESGRSDVRFYLPPELVKRDGLHGDPKYWGVELVAAGRAVPPGKSAYCTLLATPEARRNFQGRASSAATPNDGLLLPQYLTPFANEYPRATPSFVRREGR